MTNERAQYEADQLRISELEAANERLQAKITEYAALLMAYEEKFDIIAENEANRMIEFGESVHKKCIEITTNYSHTINAKFAIERIDLKQIYTNYKRK